MVDNMNTITLNSPHQSEERHCVLTGGTQHRVLSHQTASTLLKSLLKLYFYVVTYIILPLYTYIICI